MKHFKINSKPISAGNETIVLPTAFQPACFWHDSPLCHWRQPVCQCLNS